MTSQLVTALAAFAFVTLITPGPNNLMLMASGMNYGWRRTLPHLLGIGLGFPAMIVLVGLGLAQVFEIIPYSYLALKVIGAAYLLYLAWKIATAVPFSGDREISKSKPFTFIQAALFQWVNPKAWAMAVTAVSVYAPPSQPLYSIMIVALVFTAIGVLTLNSWTLLGQAMRRFLSDPDKLRLFNITCASLLVASLYPMLASSA